MTKKHILLIDDNEADNYISEFVINECSTATKVTKTISAIKALKYLETVKGSEEAFPDCIFLDIRMPEMDGFEFLEAFMQFPEAVNKQCCVIMLTSSNNQRDIDRAFGYPVVKKFFTKPLEEAMMESL
jgi:CheY-like chemotaxis protein